MVILGYLGGQWLGLHCFKPTKNSCPWLSSLWVTGLALYLSLLKWLSLALQYVSDLVWFIFKLDKNCYPWLSSQWVTELALFSSLLKMVFLGSSGSECWACFVSKCVNNTSSFLGSEWLTYLFMFLSLLITSALVSSVGKWLPTSQYFNPANKLLSWLFRK